MIEFAKPGGRAAAEALWMQAFGDPREVPARFFHQYPPERCLLADWREGHPAAMACLLPMAIQNDDGLLHGAYIYAVATDRAYRGQGLCTRLLEAAHMILQEKGADLAALVPADEKLREFYRRRGFTPWSRLTQARICGEELGGCENGKEPLVLEVLKPENARALAEFRETALKGKAPYVRWDRADLSFRISETEAYGGETLILRGAHGAAAVMLRPEGPGIKILELIRDGLGLREVLAALHRRFHAAGYDLRLPPGEPGGLETAYAEAYWYHPISQKETAYLNLALD